MTLLVVGTVAFDDIETPYGKVRRVLGGSATYFAYAASFFCPVRLVAAVGEDFPEEHIELLRDRKIDCTGLVRMAGQKSFHWSGRYAGDMNEAETLEVNLNVLAAFRPELPPALRTTPFLFMANGAPDLESAVLDQMEGLRLAVCDTMNHWIEGEREALEKVLARVDGIILNDGEARMLTGARNLVAAGERIRGMGPSFVIIKKGEHGSYLTCAEGRFGLPAFPVEEVKDPTGAGDSFAGGVMGWIAARGEASFPVLRRAMVYGTILASFNVEDFSLERFKRLRREEIDERYARFLPFFTL